MHFTSVDIQYYATFLVFESYDKLHDACPNGNTIYLQERVKETLTYSIRSMTVRRTDMSFFMTESARSRAVDKIQRRDAL